MQTREHKIRKPSQRRHLAGFEVIRSFPRGKKTKGNVFKGLWLCKVVCLKNWITFGA